MDIAPIPTHDLLTADGGEPVLVLDDVFAELDTGRRDRLARLVSRAEQVLVTAAVQADVPLEGRYVDVRLVDGTSTLSPRPVAVDDPHGVGGAA